MSVNETMPWNTFDGSGFESPRFQALVLNPVYRVGGTDWHCHLVKVIVAVLMECATQNPL